MAAEQRESLPLFAIEHAGIRLAQPIPLGLPRRRKKTAEAKQAIQLGKHPLLGLPLHADAPRIVSNKDRKYPGEARCGNCEHLVAVVSYGRRELTCELATTPRPLHRWWPACKMFRMADPDG